MLVESLTRECFITLTKCTVRNITKYKPKSLIDLRQKPIAFKGARFDIGETDTLKTKLIFY